MTFDYIAYWMGQVKRWKRLNKEKLAKIKRLKWKAEFWEAQYRALPDITKERQDWRRERNRLLARIAGLEGQIRKQDEEPPERTWMRSQLALSERRRQHFLEENKRLTMLLGEWGVETDPDVWSDL